jgi:hypothetical protein
LNTRPFRVLIFSSFMCFGMLYPNKFKLQ